ncbi:MAG TPA: OmpH family outer membrane protein [Flavobacteriia bacterium]|jgi:outer membrane protein|nr:OmpH family outer membrane protein [Flavobacteriia bacterium]
MKYLKTLLLAITLSTGMFVANAQKIAHINSEELVAAMPETKAMQDDLSKMAQNFDNDYKAQATALQAKLEKYQKEAPTKTDEENAKRQQEVAELQQKLQLYLKSAQEEMQKKQMEMIKPIIEKAQKAIQDVADAKGIKYVFDSAPGKGLIVFKGEDLLSAVKAKLGIQ